MVTKQNLYHYAVGRRKDATAVVKLFPKGTGKFSVSTKEGVQKSLKDFFVGNHYLYDNSLYPFHVLGNDALKKFDAEINVEGGGVMGQAEAIRLGFARALTEFNGERRLQLKPFGLLKRDPRQKERKKPGLRKARKSPQWSKR